MSSDILGKEYEPSQLWCEEVIDGAIYLTYLKRVPLQIRPWTWTEDATHTLWDVQKVRCISAGSLQTLVEALNKATGELDTGYTNMFLSMFRTFATVDEVLNLILERIKHWRAIEKRNRPQASTFKNSLIMVLYMWLKDYPEDYNQNPDYSNLNKLIAFADEHADESHIKAKAEQLINHFQTEVEQQDAEAQSTLSGMSCAKVEQRMDVVLNISPTLIAEQITFKDAHLLRRLIPHHCLGFYWGNEDYPDGLPTVQAIINYYNDVSGIVISSVLMPEAKASHRAIVIEHWILVAQTLRALNNFSSLNAVIKALQSTSLSRLNKTWASLSKKALANYEDIFHMFSLEANVFNSRNVLMEEASLAFYTNSKGELVRKYPKEVTMQGTIPFLDLFLSDLIDVDAAQPSRTFSGLINFNKRRQEFEILSQLQLLKKSATLYKFEKSAVFWEWFKSFRIRSAAESQRLSWTLEP